MRKLLTWILIGLFPLLLQAQGGIIVEAGANIVCTGSPSIVIPDGKWDNSGTFTSANSLVRMVGTASTLNTTIGGSAVTTFYDFEQQKTANDILLNQNMGVTHNFTMNGGLFQLNNFIVTLGSASGQIVNESELNRITGTTGGEVWKTMILNAPVSVNPGNMGAEITSAANLGNTVIHRGHVQQNDGNFGLSIERYYDIFPTTNSGLAATLRQYYFDAELAGRTEIELEHFNSTDNGLTWYGRGMNVRNTMSNYVDNAVYDDFLTRWTLASGINEGLPVTWIEAGIDCDQDHATLFWTVDEAPNSDYFQVQMSENQTQWVDAIDGRIISQGSGQHSYQYILSESAQYFRVRQVNLNGAISLSSVQTLPCHVEGAWTIWPNPVSNSLNIKAAYGNSIKVLEIMNMFGQVVIRQQMNDAVVTLCTLDLVDKLPAAVYVLKIFPETGAPILKTFEVVR